MKPPENPLELMKPENVFEGKLNPLFGWFDIGFFLKFPPKKLDRPWILGNWLKFWFDWGFGVGLKEGWMEGSFWLNWVPVWNDGKENPEENPGKAGLLLR